MILRFVASISTRRDNMEYLHHELQMISCYQANGMRTN
uniref:Uncharacterized protein n=1 Tax=Rhizophora mucronata TaxID=61149 RepID=A0A2P2QHX6_RHIMU